MLYQSYKWTSNAVLNEWSHIHILSFLENLAIHMFEISIVVEMGGQQWLEKAQCGFWHTGTVIFQQIQVGSSCFFLHRTCVHMWGFTDLCTCHLTTKLYSCHTSNSQKFYFGMGIVVHTSIPELSNK